MIVAEVCTWMPSRSKTRATRALDSGSSGARIRSAASRMSTCTPNRAKAWDISAPMAPPPMTMSEPGSSSSRHASRLVQNGVFARPGIGGADGSVPVFRTTPVPASYVVPSTSTDRGPASRAEPRTNCTPAASSRSTAAWSSQSSVASSRIRACTGPQSEVTLLAPAKSGIRRPSASTSAARTIILLGMQP